MWDEELADLARYNTVQCTMKHDKCHSTRVFYVAGQNLAEHGDTDNEKLVEWAPGFWFEVMIYLQIFKRIDLDICNLINFILHSIFD